MAATANSGRDAAVAVLRGHTNRITSVVWSPDGRWLTTGSWDKTVKVWEAVPGEEGGWRCAGTLEGRIDDCGVSAASCVVWSPDSCWLATSISDDTVRMWEVEPAGGDGWHCATVLDGHTAGICSVAWSPDGVWLATGSMDKTVRVWEAAPEGGGGCRCAATLEGHTAGILFVAWSPDSTWVSSCSMDETARVWEAVPGGGGGWRCAATLEGHTANVTSVTWSPDGARLATKSRDGTVRVFEVVAGEEGGWRCAAKLQCYARGSRVARQWDGVVWSPDGARLATHGGNCTVRVWVATPRGGGGWHCAASLEGHTGELSSVAWSHDGAWLATGSADETLRVWEVAPGGGGDWHCAAVLEGHTEEVTSVAWSPGNTWMATGSADHTARVWRPGRRAPAAAQQIPSQTQLSPSHVQPLPAGPPDVAAVAANNECGDTVAAHPEALLQVHTDAISCVSWRPDGAWLATGSWDKTVKVWDVSPDDGFAWRFAAMLDGHTSWVCSLAWSPDGDWLATGSSDSTVRVWQAEREEGGGWRCAATLKGHAESVCSVAWGPRLATASADGTVKVWAAAPARGGGWVCAATLADHTSRVHSVAWSPDGALLATGSWDRTARVWGAAPGGGGGWRCAAVLEGHTGEVWCVAWSRDGTLLATGSADKTVRLWKAAPGEERRWGVVALLEGHIGCVCSVAWSPDGGWLATGSLDSTVRLWEVAPARKDGWRCAATVRGHTERVYSVAWGPDNARLATGGADHTLRVWRLERIASAALVQAAARTEASTNNAHHQPLCPPATGLRVITPAELDGALGATRRPLGSGGFGAVFRGTLGGAAVAVKLLHTQGLQERGEAYRSEVQLLARLRHRHIVAIYAACEERHALVMELMEGGTLQERLRVGNIAWDVRLRVMFEASVALLFLHSSSPAIMHRDFKPSNIMLTRGGMAKLTDVGLAKEIPIGGSRLATHSSVAGSQGFIDPRYIQTREYRAASDVYSVGVSLLMVLLGHTDPTGTVQEVMDAKVEGEEMQLLDGRPGTGDWDTEKAAALMSLALKCVHSRPVIRPSLATVVEQLAEFRDAQPLARPTASDMVEWLECPITCELMEDPVLAKDGFTYERAAIEEHLSTRASSPMTNLPMRSNLTRNNMVRSLTEQVKEWLRTPSAE